MKRQGMALFLISIYTILMAGNYKILYLNSQQIVINENLAKVGDTFNDKSVIKWSEDRQAMKVIDIESNKRYVMVAKLAEGKEQTAYDIMKRNKHLSTHDGGLDTQDKFLKLEMSIADEYDLLDYIELPTELRVDSSHYFLGSYQYSDVRLTKRLECKEGRIIIDKSLFFVDGKKIEPRDIILRINYIDGNADIPVFIKDNIEIVIIPDKID